MPILILIIISLISGCSSQQKRQDEYAAIEKGMRKRDVLDIAGNPRLTDRRDSVDRWYYYLRPEDPASIRVIHFKNNIVIYKGRPLKPKLSAEEVETVKAPKVKPYLRTLTDKELESLIKKEMRKEKRKKKKAPQKRYEEI